MLTFEEIRNGTDAAIRFVLTGDGREFQAWVNEMARNDNITEVQEFWWKSKEV